MRTMRDSNGHDVPVKYVSAYDKARDKTARKILERFVKARAALESLVAASIDDLARLKADKAKVGLKGNFQTTSFDGLIRVSIDQQYNIQLDERVIEARELMLEYVNSVLDRVSGVDVSALRLLVESAFEANSRGFLPIGKIMSLMRMEVDNENWHKAKLILQNAIKPQKGKRYLSCACRNSTQDDFKLIRLDIATCWPEGKGGDDNAD